MASRCCGMLLAVVGAAAMVQSATVTPRGPVIGVLTQDMGEDAARARGYTGRKDYIAASYIKYLEGAGARVVPLRYEYSLDKLTYLFGKINGILFPGGGADIHALDTVYMKAVLHLWDMAIAANDKGDFFPVWGTCLGFETIAVAAARDPSVLSSGFDSEDYAVPLNFTAAATTSELLGTALNWEIKEFMTQYNTTMNNHVDGVTPTTFAENDKLNAFFSVLSTNLDRKGKVFGSTIEGRKYPVFGTQWHPEKAIYEWTNREGIPHTVQAVSVAQYTANFFVAQARNSTHEFDYDELNQYVIWNYQPIFTYPKGSNFEQEYIWDTPPLDRLGMV